MNVLLHAWPQLASGLWVTIATTMGAAVVAVLAALVAGSMRDARALPLRILATIYVEVFRGTSALIQLYWLYFVLPMFGIVLPAMAVGILGLGLCIGAYGAEVFRAARQALPRGQREAALSLGLRPLPTFVLVLLPQVFRIVLPQTSVIVIELLKASALVSLVTLHDLSFEAYGIAQETYRPLPAFAMILAIYYILARIISEIFLFLERRVDRRQER